MADGAEIRRILTAHAARYPRMQPCDAVKLLYQSEFGGGHLVTDAAGSLRRLAEEYASVAHDASLPLYEEIGNGFVRVQLAALDVSAYPLEQLNADFVRSAADRCGSADGFRAKLDILTGNAPALPFAFSQAELANYLRAYEESGFPPVSHSPEYRTAYRPAYRVLRRS